MATGLESQAVFRARGLQLGMTAAQVTQIDDAGFGTMGAFAFGSSFQPGQNDEAPLLAFFAVMFPGPPDLALIGRLRRLYYESHTVALSDMKSRIERTDEDKPRRLQLPERAQRTLEQRARLTALRLDGEYEPSFALIDKVVDQGDSGELRYIMIEDLTSRDQELAGNKKDPGMAKMFKENKQGVLQREPDQVSLRADSSTDLQLRNCLTRRGVAYDQAGLITWAVHDKWVAVMFARMSEEPPPGYSWISVTQILRADVKMWTKMAADCITGITAVPGQPLPLDVAMEKYMNHADILNFMQPMPGSGGAQRQRARGRGRSAPYGQDQPGKGKGQGEGRGNKGKGKGRGKGKGKGKNKSCAPMTPDGKYICYGFNSASGCHEQVTDGKCHRGWHICGKLGCHGPHTMIGCVAGGA